MRTGAPRPHHRGRPRAPQSSPLLPSPPPPGLRPHRGHPCPTQRPPRVRGPGLAPAGPSPQPKRGVGWVGRMGVETPSGLGGALPMVGPFPWRTPPSRPCLLVAPELSAVLGLGLGLGLLAPVAATLALLLHHRAWRLLTNTPKPPGECLWWAPDQTASQGAGPLPTSHPYLFPRGKQLPDPYPRGAH